MMKRLITSGLAVTAMALVMTGCVSTPARRIAKEPQVFSTFPPDVQAKVREGKVELGFTRDMVRLAKGRPHRLSSRVTVAGTVEVWTYVGVRHVSDRVPVDSGYWYRDRAGRLRRSYDTVWLDRGYDEEFPTLRLEFTGDAVTAIEQLAR